MPGPDHPQKPEPHIACSVCRKEIPLSVAFTPQGADYIEHFCGLECYQEFVEEQKTKDSGKPST